MNFILPKFCLTFPGTEGEKLNVTTSDQAKVLQSTHKYDPVPRIFGNNPPTGGVRGKSWLGSHSSYGENVRREVSDEHWGVDEKSISLPAIPESWINEP